VGDRVPSSGKKSSFNQEQRGLTKLQKDGIKKRLANNPVVEFVGIKLMEVAPGRSNLVLPHRQELQNSMGVLQGGILGVLADVAGGVSLYSVLSDPVKVVIPGGGLQFVKWILVQKGRPCWLQGFLRI
jgi:acyl-coenzyme A thioesterase PaaI-like protein